MNYVEFLLIFKQSTFYYNLFFFTGTLEAGERKVNVFSFLQ